MKKLTIISTNHLGIEFWENRTGRVGQIELHKLNLKEKISIDDSNPLLLFDFYFNSGQFLEEAIVNDQLNKANLLNRPCTVFILSPRYALHAIRKEEVGNITFIKHRFSYDLLSELEQAIIDHGSQLSIHAS